MVDKEKLIQEFENYTSSFDRTDPRIALKVEHTYKVAEIAEEIGKSLDDLTGKEISFCWFLGLLHDIGRFEQLKRYRTFLDSQSIDHAEFGADLLFKDGLIDKFWQAPIADMAPDEERHMIELSIRQHNKLTIPESLSERERSYCNILRDADKIDIFRVIQQTPYEVRMTQKVKTDGDRPARDEVMQCVRNHTCVPRLADRSEFESQIAGCCMGFELVYPTSRRIAKEQGYLDQMLSFEPKSEVQRKQMEELRREMEKTLNA